MPLAFCPVLRPQSSCYCRNVVDRTNEFVVGGVLLPLVSSSVSRILETSGVRRKGYRMDVFVECLFQCIVCTLDR